MVNGMGYILGSKKMKKRKHFFGCLLHKYFCFPLIVLGVVYIKRNGFFSMGMGNGYKSSVF